MNELDAAVEYFKRLIATGWRGGPLERLIQGLDELDRLDPSHQGRLREFCQELQAFVPAGLSMAADGRTDRCEQLRHYLYMYGAVRLTGLLQPELLWRTIDDSALAGAIRHADGPGRWWTSRMLSRARQLSGVPEWSGAFVAELRDGLRGHPDGGGLAVYIGLYFSGELTGQDYLRSGVPDAYRQGWWRDTVGKVVGETYTNTREPRYRGSLIQMTANLLRLAVFVRQLPEPLASNGLKAGRQRMLKSVLSSFPAAEAGSSPLVPVSPRDISTATELLKPLAEGPARKG